ncbi:hypothetical protein BOTBODRAFT_457493, partial [Botryobasidium botryosum FD-172 SS1]
ILILIHIHILVLACRYLGWAAVTPHPLDHPRTSQYNVQYTDGGVDSGLWVLYTGEGRRDNHGGSRVWARDRYSGISIYWYDILFSLGRRSVARSRGRRRMEMG